MKKRTGMINDESGFTLPELCVVILCIAVLFALLLPALAANKPKDQTANCLSNLRKWGLAQLLYTADNKDTIPPDGTMTPTGSGYGEYAADTGNSTGPASPQDPVAWFNVLPQLAGDHPLSYYFAIPGGNPIKKYPAPGNGIGKMWVCPAAQYSPSDPPPGSAWLAGGVYGLFTYAMDLDLKQVTSICNGVVGNTPYWPSGVKMASIRHPSAQVVFFDATYSPTYEGGRDSGTYPAERWNYFSSRHGKGSVIQFLDGHAAFYRTYYVTNGAGTACSARQENMNINDIWWNPNRDR
ncbi:MAG TPA: hypothetical protein VK742_03775 [Candidatus Sulfotelmatobacter sp.]|jgi:prepilin-type processing-associated H-X9-DG protein|nr:hypothetical protein [Candidatus Sulfotelmatobacter sp.]